MSTTEQQPATSVDGSWVEWGDTSFEPDPSARQYDDIRWFRMSKEWPQKPFEGRRFQLGGIERVAFLEESAYVHYAHRFNVQYMGSTVNGTRRCTMDERGHCVACQHYENAPTKLEGSKKVSTARCGPRQQQFGANLLVYKTDLEGHLLDANNKIIMIDQERGLVYQDGSPAWEGLIFEVFLWRFSADKFADVRSIKREWGKLTERDLVMTLDPKKDDKFQDFTPTVGASSAWKMLAKAGDPGKARAGEVIAYYKEHRYDLEAILGKLYTDEEMQGFIGTGTAPPPQTGDATADVAAEIERALATADPAAAPSTPPPAAAPPAQEQPVTPAPEPAPAQPAAGVTNDFDALLADV